VNTLNRQAGLGAVIIILAVAALGGGLVAVKPKWFHGESRRAAASTKATLELDQATRQQGAEAAGSVVAIGAANAAAVESPSRRFIAREVPVALSRLPAPDPLALLAAEKRRSAEMEGRALEAEKLYGLALDRSTELEKARVVAVAARARADLELEQAAAEQLGAVRQKWILIGLAAAVAVLYFWTKYTHIAPGAILSAVRDIRSGTPAIAAIDGIMTLSQQQRCRVMNAKKGDAVPEPERLPAAV
jgi:hypothetical protein